MPLVARVAYSKAFPNKQTLALDRLRQGTQSVAEQALQMLSARIGQGGQRNRDPFGRPNYRMVHTIPRRLGWHRHVEHDLAPDVRPGEA